MSGLSSLNRMRAVRSSSRENLRRDWLEGPSVGINAPVSSDAALARTVPRYRILPARAPAPSSILVVLSPVARHRIPLHTGSFETAATRPPQDEARFSWHQKNPSC